MTVNKINVGCWNQCILMFTVLRNSTQELCAKLMEIVDVASPQMKTELVSALPDIIDDPQHDDAALQLKWVDINFNHCSTLNLVNKDMTLYLLDTWHYFEVKEGVKKKKRIRRPMWGSNPRPSD